MVKFFILFIYFIGISSAYSARYEKLNEVRTPSWLFNRIGLCNFSQFKNKKSAHVDLLKEQIRNKDYKKALIVPTFVLPNLVPENFKIKGDILEIVNESLNICRIYYKNYENIKQELSKKDFVFLSKIIFSKGELELTEKSDSDIALYKSGINPGLEFSFLKKSESVSFGAGFRVEKYDDEVNSTGIESLYREFHLVFTERVTFFKNKYVIGLENRPYINPTYGNSRIKTKTSEAYFIKIEIELMGENQANPWKLRPFTNLKYTGSYDINNVNIGSGFEKEFGVKLAKVSILFDYDLSLSYRHFSRNGELVELSEKRIYLNLSKMTEF
ncbi:MAG: hypothetical protein ACJAT2_003772 [Bacteriovoracaceae bacterium]